jgi:hypothetical protein
LSVAMGEYDGRQRAETVSLLALDVIHDNVVRYVLDQQPLVARGGQLPIRPAHSTPLYRHP